MRRTTVALDDRIYERVRDLARRSGRTFQECANELLRAGLDAATRSATRRKPLPVFDFGEPAVDLADRDALYELMDRE